MKALAKLAVVGIAGLIAWNVIFKQGPGDRPSIVIRNGPVSIEEQSDGNPSGDFQKGTFIVGRSWYYHHPAHAPTHFDVVVTDSSCGSEARYDATELRVLSGGNGTSSTVTISVSGIGPLAYLAVEPDSGTNVTHSARGRIEMGGRDEQLQSVRLAGSNCAFVSGQGSITINQRH